MTRCAAALFLAPHDVHWRQVRDAAGRVVQPHTLVWECWRCGRVVGATTLPGTQVDGAAEAALVAARGAAIRRRAAQRREPAPLRLAARQDGGPRG